MFLKRVFNFIIFIIFSLFLTACSVSNTQVQVNQKKIYEKELITQDLKNEVNQIAQLIKQNNLALLSSKYIHPINGYYEVTKFEHKNIFEIRKEFITIYDTFEALDKNYIQHILVNLKAAEEANTKAVKGLEQNKKLFNSQKTIIEVLKKHKDELDKLKHLKEIDEFYNAYTNFEAYQEKNIEELRASQENIDAKFLAHQKIYNQFSDKQSVEVAKLQNSQKNFSNELDGLSDTIRNFDESMSKEMSAQKTRIDEVFSRVAQNLKDIQSETESKVETLSSDINKIVLNQKKGFDDKLENLDDTVKKLEESNLEMIDELKSTRDEAFAKIAKKIEENQNESLTQVKSIHSEMEEQLNELKEYFQNQLKRTRLLAIISFIAFIILLVLILSEVI